MDDNCFIYVLIHQEFLYWEHTESNIRKWFRAEIRTRAKYLAIQSCKPAWAIFGPDESRLEGGTTYSEDSRHDDE